MVRGTLAAAAIVELHVLADDMARYAERLQTLGASGSRAQVVNEAGRLGCRANTARDESRRLASQLDR